jgi:hypothetical protein
VCYLYLLTSGHFCSLWTETVRIRLWLSEDSFCSVDRHGRRITKKRKRNEQGSILLFPALQSIVISCTFLSLGGDFCQLYQLREKFITGVVCNSCYTHRLSRVEQLIDFLLFVYLTVINREYFGKKEQKKNLYRTNRGQFQLGCSCRGILRFMFPPQPVSDCQLLFLVLRGVRLNCCIRL